MINSPAGVNKNNPFDMVSPKVSENTYWLNDKKLKNTTILKASFPNLPIMTPEQAQKTHNARTIGLSIAAAAAVVAGGLFLVFSGGPKGLSKGFRKLRRYYERKLEQSKLNDIKSSGHYEYILGKIGKFQNKAEAVNNYTTIKDFLFKKLMYATKFTKKIHEKTTKIFENIGLKTVKKSYESTADKFKEIENLNKKIVAKLEKTTAEDTKISINGIVKTKSEWIKLAREKGLEISQLYSGGFSSTIRDSRYTKIKKIIDKLEQNFEEEGPFWFLKKSTLNTFVAEAKIQPQREELQQSVKLLRQGISYNPSDLYKDVENYILKISSVLGVNDKAALAKLNKMREAFAQMAQNGKLDPKKIEKLCSDLDISMFKASHGKKYEDYELIMQNTKNIKELCQNFKQGEVEDLLEIYKKLLPEQEYIEIEKKCKNAVSSLNKSIKLETEDFVSKARDLSMGSAPTDILNIIGGLAVFAYYLGKTDDKQERTSIMLKYGFPVIAGMGVSLYGNARLFAGTKSMLLGLISMKIFNILGNIANNALTKNNKSVDKNSEPAKA